MEEIEEAIGTWQALDLKSWRNQLKEQAHAVVSLQEQSIQSLSRFAWMYRHSYDKHQLITAKKRLVKRTHAFPGLGVEETTLVKAYQSEIDALTRRIRLSEGAFFEVAKDAPATAVPPPHCWQALYSAPDPFPLLRDLQNLQNAAPRQDTAHVAALQAKVEEYRAEFASLQNQEVTISELREELRELREAYEQNVATEVEKHMEQAGDSTNVRMSALTQQYSPFPVPFPQPAFFRRTGMHCVICQPGHASHAPPQKRERAEQQVLGLRTAVELGHEAEEREQAVVHELQTEVQQLELQLASFEACAPNAETALATESELLAREQKILSLTELKDAAQHQAQGLFKQVNSLKESLASTEAALVESQKLSAQFAQQSNNVVPELPRQAEASAAAAADLFAVQARCKDLEQQLAHAGQQAAKAEQHLASQAALVARLVKDLTMSVGTQSISLIPVTGDSAVSGAASTSSDTMPLIQVVINQRDRVKQRLQQVDEEKVLLEKTVFRLEKDSRDLTADKESLNARLQTLQQMLSDRSASPSSAGQLAFAPDLYDQSAAHVRRRDKLAGLDKITYSVTRFLLSHRHARLFVFLYLLLLHLMVFVHRPMQTHGSLSMGSSSIVPPFSSFEHLGGGSSQSPPLAGQ
eukprot:gene1560-2827_t